MGIDTSPNSNGMKGDNGPPTPSVSTSQGPPIQTWDQAQAQNQVQSLGGTVAPTGSNGGAPGLRGRSATFNAKKAVADVVRRYHPDQQAQA
jgi:hypothetical protein